jgi:hypothetical protein
MKHEHDWQEMTCSCCAWCPKCEAESYKGEIVREGEVEVVRLTLRGWLVLVVIPSFLLILGMWQVAGHLWYVGDSGNFLGYCWGTMVECFKEGK